jgi:intein/homing endonuclease
MQDKIQFIPEEDLKVTPVPFAALSQTQNWGMALANIQEVWAVSKQGEGIKVAILDTGFAEHADLAEAWKAEEAVNCTSEASANDQGSGHGCIFPSDKIYIKNLGVTDIKSFYENVEADGYIIDAKDGFEIKTLDNQCVQTLSYKDSIFDLRKVKAAHKLTYIGEVIKVKTQKSEITLTPWHPVYVNLDEKIQKINAENLKISDKILTMSPSEIIFENNKKLFYSFKYECKYCNYQSRGNKRLQCKKCNKYKWQQEVTKCIELDEKLAFLAGLIVTDGHIMKNDNSIEFSGINKNLVDICSNLFYEIFGITARHYSYTNKNMFSIRANGIELKRFFVEQLGIPYGNKSLTLRLPNILKTSSDNVFYSFLAGVIEGDGSIDKDWRVRICSGSKLFVQDLEELLRFRGIKSSIIEFSQSLSANKGYHLKFTPSKDIVKYLKIKKANRDLPKTSFNYERIIEISTEFYSGDMYDLTVDGTSNYIANGFVVSNTHVAGIIAGSDNDFGVVGVAPKAKCYAIRVLDNSGSGSYDTIAAGLRKAIDLNVDIINMSLGAPTEPPAFIHDLIKEAVSKGIVVLAAAGNDSHAVNYPARYDEVIAVAALDESGNLATFTSRDFTVDIVAPGTNIYSTHLNNNYCKMSGTSQSAPFVAGICALIKAALKNQNLLPEFGNQFCQEDMMVALRNISSLQNYQVQPGEEQNWGPGVPKLANIDWSNITVKKS